MSAIDRQERARADLQQRLAVLFKVMFWSCVALILYVWWQNNFITDNKIPVEHRDIVYAYSAVGLIVMAVIWRVFLVGRRQSLSELHRTDFIYSLGVGLSFGAGAYLQKDLRASGYMALVYTMFTVFARALLVPSSARRTFATSMLTFIPMSVAALAVAATAKGLTKANHQLTPTAFFFSAANC